MNKKKAQAYNLTLILSAGYALIYFLSAVIGRFFSNIVHEQALLKVGFWENAFRMAPAILMVLYLYVFYKQNRRHILLPISYIAGAVIGVFNVILAIVGIVSVFVNGFTFMSFMSQLGTIFVSCIYCLAFAFLAVDCFLKFRLIGISRLVVTGLALVGIIEFICGFISIAISFFASFGGGVTIGGIIFGIILWVFNLLNITAAVCWPAAHFMLWTRLLNKPRKRQ